MVTTVGAGPIFGIHGGGRDPIFGIHGGGRGGRDRQVTDRHL